MEETEAKAAAAKAKGNAAFAVVSSARPKTPGAIDFFNSLHHSFLQKSLFIQERNKDAAFFSHGTIIRMNKGITRQIHAVMPEHPGPEKERPCQGERLHKCYQALH